MTEDTKRDEAEEKAEVVKLSPKHLGDRDEISVVNKRLIEMMPGAATFPKPVLYATAQLAVAYRLDPFNGEIYVAKMGREQDASGTWVDKYSPIIGIKGFRTLARRASNYVIEQPVREMDDEEIRKYRGDAYDPQDVGVEVKLFRLDVARECRDSGVPYYPVVSRGFWRAKVSRKRDRTGKETGEWNSDNIPETWTRHEVAEKRAEKSAIVKAFDLRVPPQHLSDETFDYDAEMESLVQERDRATAIQHRKQDLVVEENGDILYGE